MTAPLTDRRLDEIEAAIPADWPGPAFSTPAGGNHAFISNRTRDFAEVLDCGDRVGPFIAMALNALPELLTEVRRLRRNDEYDVAKAERDRLAWAALEAERDRLGQTIAAIPDATANAAANLAHARAERDRLRELTAAITDGPWAWAESVSWSRTGTFTIPISRPAAGGDVDSDLVLDALAAEVLHAMLGDLLNDHDDETQDVTP